MTTDAERYPYLQAWNLNRGRRVLIDGERYVSLDNAETIARAHSKMTVRAADLQRMVADLNARLKEVSP